MKRLFIFLSFFLSYFAVGQELPEEASDFLYLRAEKLFNQGNREAASGSLELFFQSYAEEAKPATKAMAHNLQGILLLREKKYYAALREFKVAEELVQGAFNADHPYLHLIRYNISKTIFHTHSTRKVLEFLLTIRPELLDMDTSIRYYNFLGRTYKKQDQLSDAVLAFLMAANSLEGIDSGLVDVLIKKAYKLSKLALESNVDEVLSNFNEYKLKMMDEKVGTWALLLIMAKAYSYVGNYDDAKDFLERFLEKTHPLREEAIKILSRFESLSTVNMKKIGILLPLSGKFSYYGKLSLKAIMLGAGLFNKKEAVDGEELRQDISFVIRDSGSKEKTALEAFDSLVIEDKVASVIGPLLSRHSNAISYRAREYGVPLFNLSQRSKSNWAGSYIFPIALSPEQQIRFMLDYLMDKKEFRRFAILAPNSRTGDEYVRIFWDLVEKKSGTIVALERYSPGSTDFRYPIKKLLGLHYVGARTIEMGFLEERKEEYEKSLKEKSNRRKRLLRKFDLKPIVNFDALFVPDTSTVIGQVAPSLAVYNVKNIPLLGINAWNTMDTVRRAGPFLQKSFFVDVFHKNSKNERAIWFINMFKKYFGINPGTLEVQAYDASHILFSTLQEAEIEDRADLRSYLLYKQDYEGVSGKISFTEQGVNRTTQLLGVRKNKIVEISPTSATQ